VGEDARPIGSDDTLDASSDHSVPNELAHIADRIGGRYEVLGWIGAGGMGSVYRVRDAELDEIVALKMLRRALVGDAQSLERFRTEVKLARRVTHPNVARTFDIGDHDGEKFLTMEYVEGEPLSRTIARGPLDLANVIDIGLGVSAGLSAAHAAGVVHRDLKPDNVLLGKGGRVVITDFGIARAYGEGESKPQTGSIVGTPAYMAPEQVDGKSETDSRADIYALGTMLFEMVTGRAAWQGDTPIMTALARLQKPPPDARLLRPETPRALGDAILRCMARAPSDRFPRVIDLAEKLHEAGVAASERVSPSMQTPRPLRPNAMVEVPRVTETAVAVLPLRNAASADDDFIVDGLTDDLIDTLSMTAGLRVRPRAIVARYHGTQDDLRVVGRDLGVHVVVDGSVRKAGGSVRLSLRVISVIEGFQLWAGRFDAQPGDLLVVADEAARAIATALTVKVDAPVREALSDGLAIELYFRAKREFRESWHSSMTVAVDLFEQALARAPTNPEILAGCALAFARMAFFSDAAPGISLARARELADHAVALGPHLGDSWAALYSVHMNAGDPIASARALREGVAHAPKSAQLQEMLGRILLEIGDARQAISRLEAALSFDPTAVAPEFELARAHALLGDWAKCDEILTRPSLNAGTGAISRARFALWRALPPPVPPDATPANSYQRLWCQILTTRALDEGQRAFMNERTTTAAGRLRALFWQRNAEVLAFVGEHEAALRAVFGAIDAGLIDILWVDRCPLLADLRTDPRWAELRTRVVERVRPIAEVLGFTA
jgi:serine/threonine-protein kinase